jgi:hypothetical protein
MEPDAGKLYVFRSSSGFPESRAVCNLPGCVPFRGVWLGELLFSRVETNLDTVGFLLYGMVGARGV